MLLRGIRVLDLSRVLAGPLCTMMLGDLGADVLKVERPGVGDDTRGWGPPFDARGESAYYLSVNRNKLGAALDLDRPEDARLVAALAAGADVVVDNFRPAPSSGAASTRRRCSPRTPTSCGAPSRASARVAAPGYDFVVQAERGWMSINGEPDGDPLRAGVALVDVVTGKDAADRDPRRPRRPARPGAPLPAADGRLTCRSPRARRRRSSTSRRTCSSSGRDARRWGNAHPNLVPYQLFAASDRPLVVAWAPTRSGAPAPGARPPRAGGRRPLRHQRRPARAPRRPRRPARRAPRERPAADWRARLEGAGVPSGEVRTVLETLREVEASPLTGVAPSVPGEVRRPPPQLDEHGALVRALGWGAFAAG
jgi:crotonobetainyl-CoA:carnitine CoA-transferase CaiB-like acyl-CoA transferase